jgi:hypothetical protein
MRGLRARHRLASGQRQHRAQHRLQRRVVDAAMVDRQRDRLVLAVTHRRLGAIERQRHQLLHVAAVRGFVQHPVRRDRVAGPQHDHRVAGHQGRFDGLGEGRTAFDQGVPPDLQPGLLQRLRQHAGAVLVRAGITQEDRRRRAPLAACFSAGYGRCHRAPGTRYPADRSGTGSNGCDQAWSAAPWVDLAFMGTPRIALGRCLSTPTNVRVRHDRPHLRDACRRCPAEAKRATVKQGIGLRCCRCARPARSAIPAAAQDRTG